MSPDNAPCVLVIGRFHVDSVAEHIAETWESLGREVIRFESGFRIRPTLGPLGKRVEQVRNRLHELSGNFAFVRERFTQRLLDVARSAPIDHSVVCYDFLQPREVAQLREASGAPVAIWFPDAISNFTKCWFLNAPYDALFFKDPFIVSRLRATLDKPVHYLPEACNPARHRPLELGEAERAAYACDVATAGNLYAYRAEFFARLADLDVKIWGNPPPLWMDTRRIDAMIQRRYVVHDEKVRAFLAARIVLNNLHPAEVWGINARAFEIAGIGGFQMIDWRPGLAQLFEDGVEIVSFRDYGELRAKIDHYLAHPEERALVARRACERAHRDHGFAQRLRLLQETLAGRAAGFPLPDIAMEARSSASAR